MAVKPLACICGTLNVRQSYNKLHYYTVGFHSTADKSLALTFRHRASSLYKKKNLDSLPIDMLLSAASVLVVAQSSSEVPEGLMNNPV